MDVKYWVIVLLLSSIASAAKIPRSETPSNAHSEGIFEFQNAD